MCILIDVSSDHDLTSCMLLPCSDEREMFVYFVLVCAEIVRCYKPALNSSLADKTDLRSLKPYSALEGRRDILKPTCISNVLISF